MQRHLYRVRIHGDEHEEGPALPAERQRGRSFKDDEELRDLIDTIASKTLAGELEAASDLLSDLMATNMMDRIDESIFEDAKNEPEKYH